jgi:hypothetical protein
VPPYRIPECLDVAQAPERASLAILSVALHAVEQALYVQHPTLMYQEIFQSRPPRTLALAAKIIDRCDKLANLIEQYDQAVEDALGGDSDPIPF